MKISLACFLSNKNYYELHIELYHYVDSECDRVYTAKIRNFDQFQFVLREVSSTFAHIGGPTLLEVRQNR